MTAQRREAQRREAQRKEVYIHDLWPGLALPGVCGPSRRQHEGAPLPPYPAVAPPPGAPAPPAEQTRLLQGYQQTGWLQGYSAAGSEVQCSEVGGTAANRAVLSGVAGVHISILPEMKEPEQVPATPLSPELER